MDDQQLTLNEAATRFLVSLTPEERQSHQHEVYRFARWCGGGKSFSELKPPHVANYAERLSLSDTDYTEKLEMARSFLAYARKQGWYKTSLITHLKARKGKNAPKSKKVAPRTPDAISLTPQRKAELEAELAGLKDKRSQLIKDIQRAAADKDFKENAPLAAAREQRGHVEGQINELEETLKTATIIDLQGRDAFTVGTGDSIRLRDLSSGEELRYNLVSPREVDPSRGKISTASPTGRALIGRKQGEVIEVAAPVGKFRYQIEEIER